MNKLAKDILMAAAMRGQKQTYEMYEDEEGLCALGVLGFRFNQSDAAREGLKKRFALRSNVEDVACPECGRSGEERAAAAQQISLLVHLNDDHRFDFLTIANKMPLVVDER